MKNQRLIYSLLLLVLVSHGAQAQLAPAGDVLLQGAPGEYYLFFSEGSFKNAASFVYLNYSTGDFDTILPNVAPDGSFKGTSGARVLTGRIDSTTIRLTYNGATVSGPKTSSYGPTRRLAWRWSGLISYPNGALGAASVIIDSQGQIFALATHDSVFEVGIGVINAKGKFTVPLVSGTSISGVFDPVFGRFGGSFNESTGEVDYASMLRAIPSRLVNISTRGFVGTGEQVLIGGFVIRDGGKTVFIDAKGPSLGSLGVANAVQATQISLFSGTKLIASNNGWRNNTNVAEIEASGIAPTDDRESALQVALEPGAYTVVVASGDSSSGIGLVEVYGVGDSHGP